MNLLQEKKIIHFITASWNESGIARKKINQVFFLLVQRLENTFFFFQGTEVMSSLPRDLWFNSTTAVYSQCCGIFLLWLIKH